MILSKTNEAAHKRLSLLIFGLPKVGKTTLAKTLPVSDDSKLLYINADPGQIALRDREFTMASAPNGKLSEEFFDEVLEHIRTQGKNYEWIFVDGVDEVAQAILKSKLQTQRDARKAYGEMAEYVEGWMKAIRDVEGISVVFVTHIEQEEIGEGEVQFIPQFPGKKIQSQVDAWFDLVGCMRLVKDSEGTWKRCIQFRREADARYVVGDRSGVTSLYEEPDLGNLFRKIHDAGYETRGTWIDPLPTAEDFKALAGMAKTHGVEKGEVEALAQKMFAKGVLEVTSGEMSQLMGQISVRSVKS